MANMVESWSMATITVLTEIFRPFFAWYSLYTARTPPETLKDTVALHRTFEH